MRKTFFAASAMAALLVACTDTASVDDTSGEVRIEPTEATQTEPTGENATETMAAIGTLEDCETPASLIRYASAPSNLSIVSGDAKLRASGEGTEILIEDGGALPVIIQMRLPDALDAAHSGQTVTYGACMVASENGGDIDIGYYTSDVGNSGFAPLEARKFYRFGSQSWDVPVMQAGNGERLRFKIDAPGTYTLAYAAAGL